MMLKNCPYYQCRQKYCKSYKACRQSGAKCPSACAICQISATCLYNIPESSGIAMADRPPQAGVLPT